MFLIWIEGDSPAVWFKGSFSDYVADCRNPANDEARKPRRLRFKALTG